MVKIVTLFLIFILVLGMFGRLQLLLPKKVRDKAQRCPGCNRYRIGKGPCKCGHKA